MSRSRMLLVSMLAIIMLMASIGVRGTNSDMVIVPLVEEDGNTGIPVKIEDRFVSISLITPKGQTIHVPLKGGQHEIIVIIVDGPDREKQTISLQDWPQSGDVIPLSQDWPQGGELHIPLQDWPQKTTLCIIIPQDWPQHQIEGTLLLIPKERWMQ